MLSKGIIDILIYKWFILEIIDSFNSFGTKDF